MCILRILLLVSILNDHILGSSNVTKNKRVPIYLRSQHQSLQKTSSEQALKSKMKGKWL